MKNDVEQNCVAFHNQAVKLLGVLYHQFQQSTTALDRQGDENVFQQLQGSYALQLKQQLQQMAMQMLASTAPQTNTMQLHCALSHIIEGYENEFLQKVRAL